MNIEQARQLAKDETTSPEILAELARSEDYQTRQRVAENPNTPTKVLLKICREFPSELMNNPVVPLLLLENPYIFSCEIKIDFNTFIHLTDLEIKRLGWKPEEGKNHLLKNYGKRTRLHLTDSECLDYLSKLQQLKN
ncbi:MAG: hypothetical protein QNJ32_23820 [Xenococcaceae cyanobacterium MO_167.B27]|nr:hypothetical protein [Xenococcaceae cyanobacterium MO_167.B27]